MEEDVELMDWEEQAQVQAQGGPSTKKFRCGRNTRQAIRPQLWTLQQCLQLMPPWHAEGGWKVDAYSLLSVAICLRDHCDGWTACEMNAPLTRTLPDPHP